MADLMMAEEVRDVALRLIAEHHPTLMEDCRIEYLFLLANNSAELGKVKRVTDDVKRVVKDPPDFIVTVWSDWWGGAEDHQRKALVDHLLCHCGKSPTDGKTFIRPHDFEGFAVEVQRHGAWDPSLQRAGEQFRLHFGDVDEDETSEPASAHDPTTGEVYDIRGAVRDLCPKEGSGIESVTFSIPGSERPPVVLTSETRRQIEGLPAGP